jgi:transcriptional regulator with XRE-family HTH domain
MKIGARLRELRLQKNLSFAAIASQIGVTRSLLSLIEKDKTTPSIATLVKILNVLDVKMSDFFREIEKPSGVVLKKDERAFFQDVKTKMRFASLSKKFSSPQMESFYVEFEPGCVSDVFSSQKQVFMYVLEGRIELVLGEESLLLNKGDSIYFDAAEQHVFKAAGKKRAAAIAVSNGTATKYF